MQSKNNLDRNVGGPNCPERKHTRRSVEERRRIVEETFVPGVSVAAIGRRHGVNANQIFTWRKQYHAGKLGSGTAVAAEAGFVPVQIITGNASADQGPSSGDPLREGPIKNGTKASAMAGDFPWAVEVELSCGIRARFVSDAVVDTMRRVLSVAREFA